MAIRLKRLTSGFTLVEVIISILLFALIIIAFSSILSVSLNIHKKALDTTSKSMEGASNMAKHNVTTSSTVGDVTISSSVLSNPVIITGSYYKDQSGNTKFQVFEPSGVRP